MLTRTRRRRVVEEEVTELVSDESIDAYFKRRLEERNRELRERMKYEQNRLDSFTGRLLGFDISLAQRLAKAGFYEIYLNTVCFSCGLSNHLYFWQKVHDPETVHREEKPDCEFVTGQSDNVPMGLSVLRRFQIFISNTFNQNEEIEQQDYNHTKLRSENQQLEVDTGTKPKQITKNENSDEKQKENIKRIRQPSLPGVSKPDKSQEKKIHIIKPLKEKSQYQTKIDTVPNKGQKQPERKKYEKFTKTNQSRPTEQRTSSCGDAEEISGTKRQASDKPDVIPSTSNPPDVPFTSNKNHAGQNVHQRSAPVARSSSSDVRVEMLTSRRETRAGTSTTYQELEKGSAPKSIKEKTVSATRSRSSDAKKNKSATTLRSDQEHFTSCSSGDGFHTVRTENTTNTSPEDSAGMVKPGITRQECFTSEIPCSTVTDSVSQQSGPTEIPESAPQHPQFSDESMRLSTFSTWEVQSPKTLCKAGFFYTGEKDAVRCFHCDGSLCNWERAHDPFTEHARWYPNCGFIKSVKFQGSEFHSRNKENKTTVAVVPKTVGVKPTTPVDACALLQSLIRDNKETQQKSRVTEIKLQVLMDAMSNQQPSGPRPMPLESTTSSSQEMMSAQSQLQWHQSSQDSTGSRFRTVSRSDHVMYQQMMMAPPAAEIIQRADPIVLEHHRILMMIASVITSTDELTMLGICLCCDPNDVRRLKNRNPSLKDAAYEILCSFYNSVPNEERWGILIEALREQKKNLTVKELRLEELHQQAQSSRTY